MKPIEHKVELDGRTYSFNGNTWFDTGTFQVPPTAVQNKLDSLLAEKDSVARMTDFNQVLQRAKQCRQSKNYAQALRLARRAMELEPGNLAVHAVICSIYRDQGRPEKALEATGQFARCDYQPLLTSRAAALCDLERWEEAKRVIGKVLAIGKTEEAFQVVQRIKSARPELYSKKRR